MHMKPNDYSIFCERLLERGRFEQVSVSSLRLDRVCQNVLDRASIVTSLRGRPLQYTQDDHGAALLDSVQNPIMAYLPRGNDHVAIVSGVFTYLRLLEQQTTK